MLQKKDNDIIEDKPKQWYGTIILFPVWFLAKFVTFFFTLTVLVVLINTVFFQQKNSIDIAIFNYVQPYVNDTNTIIMIWFTFFGSHWFLIPAYLVLFAYEYFLSKIKWDLIRHVTIGISSLLIMFGLKFLFHRPRPLRPLLGEVPGLSFPSGHALMSLVFFGLVINLVYYKVSNTLLKWIIIVSLTVFILVIGISRIYFKVHYATDVIAGYCFGLLLLMIFFWLLQKIKFFYLAKKSTKIWTK